MYISDNPKENSYSPAQLKTTLSEMLQNAEDNGYSLHDWSPVAIAADIIAHTDELGGADFSEIVTTIEQIQTERKDANS